MRDDVTVVVPGIRKSHWPFLYKTLCNSVSRDFQLIIVSPYDLPDELADKDNIKFVKDYGSPARCQQIGLCHTTTKYVTWAADDCAFFKGRLEELLQFYESNKTSEKDIGIYKYFEGACGQNGVKHSTGQTEMSKWSYYKISNACSWLNSPFVPSDYWLLNSGILETTYAKEMGGWDTSFECTFPAHTDFAIRTQNDGSKYVFYDKPLLHCTHTPGITGDHGPVHFGQIQHDEPLLKSIYSNPESAHRTKIDLNNWQNSPDVWVRRFGNFVNR